MQPQMKKEWGKKVTQNDCIAQQYQLPKLTIVAESIFFCFVLWISFELLVFGIKTDADLTYIFPVYECRQWAQQSPEAHRNQFIFHDDEIAHRIHDVCDIISVISIKCIFKMSQKITLTCELFMKPQSTRWSHDICIQKLPLSQHISCHFKRIFNQNQKHAHTPNPMN